MDKYEYGSGLPEVGIVPRAPHGGPLLQHVERLAEVRSLAEGLTDARDELRPPS